jgi:radical SAM superfamily enzyme YgiQ (UPF0313 family)
MSLFEAKHVVRCCFIQLYGDLQPANAEPLSIEKLAGAIHSSFETISVQLYVLGTFQTEEEKVRIMSDIVQEKYDLIGLSCPQGTYEIALETLSAIYALPAPYVVLGHALPTNLPEIFLLPYPQVFIVRGWGESAIVALCRQILERHIQPEFVPGLTYLDKDGRRHDNPPDWTDAPPPTDRIDPGRYFARVEGSRGCHYNVCTFCSRPPLRANQPPWMRISSRNVLAEIERLVQMGVTTFTFADEDFIGNDPDGAYDLARQLCQFPNLDFALSVRTDNIFVPSGSEQENRLRRQILQTLKDAGLSLVFVGIESFAPTQLRRFGKGTSPENHIKAIRLLESLNIELELGLILFDPLVTLDELRANVQALKKTGLWCYAGQLFSFLRPQVGTPYVKLLKQQGLLGELRVNMAEYTASYQDDRAAYIAQYCKEWNKSHHRLYMALRNVNRSELGTGRFVNAVHRYRYLQLVILETLLEQVVEENGGGVPDLHLWSKDLAAITQELRFHLRSLSSRTSIEDHLLNIIA